VVRFSRSFRELEGKWAKIGLNQQLTETTSDDGRKQANEEPTRMAHIRICALSTRTRVSMVRVY